MKYIVFLIICISILIGCAEHESEPFSPREVSYNKKIDDFDDGDLDGVLGGTWASEKDGDTTTLDMDFISGYDKTKGALRVDYLLNSWCGINLDFGKRDFSKYTGLRLMLKGSGHKVRIHVCTKDVTDNDWYSFYINESHSYWTEYVVPFSKLARKGFGDQDPAPKFNAKNIFKIQVQTDSGAYEEDGWYAVDEIYFYKVD